jgi:hypothetical protein
METTIQQLFQKQNLKHIVGFEQSAMKIRMIGFNIVMQR